MKTEPHKVPPYSEEAERCVLGSVLLEPERVIDLVTQVGIVPDAFFLPPHRVAFQVALEMHQKNQPIDLLTFCEYAKRSCVMDTIGGNLVVESLIESTPTAAHAEHYAGIVYDHFLRRSIITRARAAMDACYYGEDKADIILASAQKSLSELIVTSDNRELHEVAVETVESWRKVTDSDTAIRWPLPDMHAKFSHITDELILLAAQPSVGKTAFAVQMCVQMALRGVPCSLLSLESAVAKVAQRIIAQLAEMNTIKLRGGKAPPQHYDNALKAARSLKDIPFRVTNKSMTLEQIRAWAMAEKSRGARFLALDNVKHIRSNKVFKNRFDLFAELSIGLKFIRDDVGLPLMALHHTNAEDKLAWSADFQRDADIIALMAQDAESIQSTTSLVDFTFLKNREGATGTIQLRFDKEIQTFFALHNGGMAHGR